MIGMQMLKISSCTNILYLNVVFCATVGTTFKIWRSQLNLERQKVVVKDLRKYCIRILK